MIKNILKTSKLKQTYSRDNFTTVWFHLMRLQTLNSILCSSLISNHWGTLVICKKESDIYGILLRTLFGNLEKLNSNLNLVAN